MLDEIKKQISQGESDTLEFKTSTAQLKSSMETLCAFLNHKGGRVLIGITNDGKMLGQDVTDNTRQEIARELKKIEPHANIETTYQLIEKNKQIIVLHAIPDQHAPYTYDGRPYYRNQSTTSRMSPHQYEQLLLKRSQTSHSWETWSANGFTIDALDHEEIRRTVRQAVHDNRLPATALNESIEDILSGLYLLNDNQLTNAAMVLYAKEMLPHYPQCHLQLARFIGTDQLQGFIDNQQLYGNAFKLLNEADTFIRRHLPIASIFHLDQLEREDRPPVPTLAVREAIVNAICHRNYSDRSTSITVSIFDDRMEIWNIGSLPSALTLEDLTRKHKSIRRNPLISEAFYLRHYIDRYGTGTTRMIDLCREHNIPAPMFEENSGGITVIFNFREAIGRTIIKENKIALPDSLTPRQREIIQILTVSNHYLSASQISKFLKEPPAARTLRDDLSKLKNLGLIESHGHARAAKWILTSKLAKKE